MVKNGQPAVATIDVKGMSRMSDSLGLSIGMTNLVAARTGRAPRVAADRC